ncbi:MAG: ATP-binding protein, partial [Desulfonatronovibrio sp.]
MIIKPWTEIATPHEDVLKGTFKQAEFAADLSRIREGSAGPEYQDPVSFFQRTYITEGMRLLFDSLVKRLNGGAGDPVIQLQTAFGGGKTHTMVGVYHIAGGEVPVSELQGVPPILDAAGINNLPRANIAVIDGNRLSPSQPIFQDGFEIRTLWGEIAWQLGGEAAFSMLADADGDGVSPGKKVLVSMFQKFGPVVILMDEMVAYMRQFEEGKSYPGGTLESNMSFIQALTESLTATDNSMMFVSLPESNAELGGDRGQHALNAMEKYFGRVHALWKPVATEEAFEIVRRRLFNPITDEDAVKEVCQSFSKYYQDNSQDFPGEAIEGAYYRRLAASYPIHPEVFDRLYEDWSTMDKFQRTRGVLQLLATAIYRLWKDGNRDPMIMPGSLPLSDSNVKNQSLYYLSP